MAANRIASTRPRLVLMTADTVGGVWTYAVELSRALAQRGVRVALASMGAAATDGQRAQVAAIDGVTLHASAFRLEWMEDPWADVERAGTWLMSLERELEPDLVHLNQFAFGALAFRAPTLLVAHSCVCSWWRAVHGEPAPPSWSHYREVVAAGLAGADLVGAPTRSMLRSLGVDYGFHGEGVVLPNGRDPAVFRPGPKAPVVFAAGRLWDAAKNLAALDAVAPSLPWEVRVAGPTAHPDGGEAVASGVTMLGVLPQATLARELAAASIYAFPARYEPFGLSVLEAALAGCALVLGDVPSLREIWGPAAVYVSPDDHDALREAIGALAADTPRREALAAAARARALTYTPDGLAAAYLAAYARLPWPAGAAARGGARPVEGIPCAS
jgi:glycogen(starch) synthase